MKIQDLRAREIIDCKGKPLLEVDIITEDVLSCTVFVKKNFLCKEFCIIAARNSWRQI